MRHRDLPTGTLWKLATFFREPTDQPSLNEHPTELSTLFLLRREIQETLIGAIVAEDQVLAQPSRHRVFASAMLIFTGFDLLGRFAFGESKSGIRSRFTAFLERFATVDGRPMSQPEAEVLWAYRSALAHTFGLTHHDAKGAVVPMFLYQADRPGPVITQAADRWEVSLDDLYEAFVLALRKYQETLKTEPDLLARFETAYERYGTLQVRGAHIA